MKRKKGDWSIDKIIQWFKDNNWLEFKNEDELMKDFYNTFSKPFISEFKDEYTYYDWEARLMEWTGYGMDLDG